jgi:hypothetical protein
MSSKKFITIDPGTHLGIAVWNYTDKAPIHAFELNGDRRFKMLTGIIKGMSSEAPDSLRVYCENASLMKGSTKGVVTAESGALVKLAQSIGRIIQICEMYEVHITLVPVMKWKGTLPKNVCEDRIRRILPDIAKKTSNHVIDAIGIGLHIKGEF